MHQEKHARSLPPPPPSAHNRLESGTQLKGVGLAPPPGAPPVRAVTIPPPPRQPTACRPGEVRQPAPPPRAQHVVLADTQAQFDEWLSGRMADVNSQIAATLDEGRERLVEEQQRLIAELTKAADQANHLVNLFRVELSNKGAYHEKVSAECKKDLGAVIALEAKIRGLCDMMQANKGLADLLENATAQAQEATSEVSHVAKLGAELETRKRELGELIVDCERRTVDMQAQFEDMKRQGKAHEKAFKVYGPRTSFSTILLWMLFIALSFAWATDVKPPIKEVWQDLTSSAKADTSAPPAPIVSVTPATHATPSVPSASTALVRTPLPPSVEPIMPAVEPSEEPFSKEDCNADGGKYFPRSKLEKNISTGQLERTIGVTLWSCASEGRRPITGSNLDCAYGCTSQKLVDVQPASL